jgi:hypothetical protein
MRSKVPRAPRRGRVIGVGVDAIVVPECRCGCGKPAFITKDGTIRDHARHHQNTRADPFEGRCEREPDTGCMNWTGAVTPNGYGQASWRGKHWSPQVLAWTLRFGDVPDGHTPDHVCTNRLCINTDHLDLVTYTENTRRSSATKLMQSWIPTIKKSISLGIFTQAQWARMLGVTHPTISRIVHGQAWL